MNEKELRNKLIKARVTESERELIKEKAKKYGYKNVSKYLIDAVLYENVTVVEIRGQDIILKAFSDYAKEIKKARKDIVEIKKYATTLNSNQSKQLMAVIFSILRNQDTMIDIIGKKLNLNVFQKKQRKAKGEM